MSIISTSISIPDNLKSIIKEMIVTPNKKIEITLGQKYSFKKINEPILYDFATFEIEIEKALKQKNVEEKDIAQIISLIENNHVKIYPDDDEEYDDNKSISMETEKETKPIGCVTRPDISIEEWQSKFFEQYGSIKQTCNKNFPGLWNSLEFELSIMRILNVKGMTLPFAGIILGPPSSSKTLGIELFRNHPNVYYSDNFSAKAFVSHSTSVSKEKLSDIDLLPRIKNKCLLAPELSPIFSKKDEEVIEILGILTRVLDGHGYQSDSGAQGRRGYSGQHMFTLIGAAVDIPARVYKHLSNLGPKLFFFRIPRLQKKDDEYIKMLKEDDFDIKKQELQEKINEYNEWFDQCYPIEQHVDKNNNLLKIPFQDNKNAAEYEIILKIIANLGKLLARLRGTVTTYDTSKTQGSNYSYSTPKIEEPDRAMTQLLNLAKGHAISQGRTFLTLDDIPILIKVVLSTASIERTLVFDLLLANQGSVTASILRKSLKISKQTALKTMAELEALGLVSGNTLGSEDDESDYDDYGYYDDRIKSNRNKIKKIELSKDFEWFLSEDFQRLREGFTPQGKSKYDKDNAEEMIKSVKKNSPYMQQKILSRDIDKSSSQHLEKQPSIVSSYSITSTPTSYKDPIPKSPAEKNKDNIEPSLSSDSQSSNTIIQTPLPLPLTDVSIQTKDDDNDDEKISKDIPYDVAQGSLITDQSNDDNRLNKDINCLGEQFKDKDAISNEIQNDNKINDPEILTLNNSKTSSVIVIGNGS